jgi:hypothetical protein
MNDLIQALQILSKYGNPEFPTHCEHDELTITPEIRPDDVSEEDKQKLELLGFFVSNDYGHSLFKSFRFGSC